MRIQNTEMEFISFDAQDVIATSGVFTLNASSYYRMTGFLDNVEKNSSISMYDSYADASTSTNAIATWSFFQNGNESYPDGINNNDVRLTKESMGATVSVAVSRDKTGTAVGDARWDNGIYKWISNTLTQVTQ